MRHDAIVIGGSFAGLSAAIYIARARRSVCIIDTGLPRNRFAEQSHGFFSRDGSAPGDMIATARQQVAAYPATTFIDTRAVSAQRTSEGFAVTLANGDVVESRYLVLAFGIRDELPAIPGIAERWGKTVLHCPYCHGIEFAGQKLGVLRTSPMSSHQALLINEWGPTTYYLNGAEAPDADTLAEFARRNIVVEPAPVRAVLGEGTSLSAIALADGREDERAALYIGPRNYLTSDIAEQLGCAIDDGPFGQIIRTDEMKATTVPGVYAVGDITRGGHNITWASGDGVTAAAAIHRALVF